MPCLVDGEILAESPRRPSGLLDLAHHGGGIGPLLLGVGMMDRQPRADAAERQRNGPADFAAGAGDQRRTAGQAEEIERIDDMSTPDGRQHGRLFPLAKPEGRSRAPEACQRPWTLLPFQAKGETT